MSEAEITSPAPDGPLARIPFTERAENSIRALCNWMQAAAIISILGAVFKVVNAFVPRQDFSKIVDAIITALIAVWIYQAGVALRKVVTTDRADQRYLMDGFRRLRRVFLLQAILVILVLAFLVLTVGILGVVLLARAGGAQ